MSDNERYGIQIANYDVYVLINGRRVSLKQLVDR